MLTIGIAVASTVYDNIMLTTEFEKVTSYAPDDKLLRADFKSSFGNTTLVVCPANIVKLSLSSGNAIEAPLLILSCVLNSALITAKHFMLIYAYNVL